MSSGRGLAPPTESSISDILRMRAATQPDRQIFVFLEDGSVESESLTYAQLDRRARAIAAALREQLDVGDRVLLLYPPGLEFICAIFGCFYAGAVAVPAYPPRLQTSVQDLQSLGALARNCEPRALLTGGELGPLIAGACAGQPELANIPRILTDSIHAPADSIDLSFDATRETIAMLQYTSGSTGDPKGVVLTHGNLLANEYVIQLAFHHRTATRPGGGVCWLPFYHDMGLMGNVLQAVYVDGPCYLMSPLIMLQRPIRWLEAISRYRAHSSGGPNFAFDLCTRRITPEQKAGLDLSCWELACIGAEPISPETIDRFTAAFAECGFKREAFFPGYGLAEATVFVSGGDKEALPVIRDFAIRGNERILLSSAEAEGRAVDPASSPDSEIESLPRERLVGCGWAWTDHELLIVDPEERTVCPPGQVGEIWFRGPSVARGYWNRPEETAAVFDAQLRDGGTERWLRSGDLGFIADGNLFVSGRLKDVIVIRGSNYYPQDIEATAAGVHESLRAHAAAAFGTAGEGAEQLVLLLEIDRQTRQLDLEQLDAAVRKRVATVHQIQVSDLLFLRNGTLPKTTSGKVRRQECRQRYLTQQLTLWQGKPSA